MNTPFFVKNLYFDFLHTLFNLDESILEKIDFVLNVDADRIAHKDISSNAALVIARIIKQAPRNVAQTIIEHLARPEASKELRSCIKSVEIAGPGFLNFELSAECWLTIAQRLLHHPETFFIAPEIPTQKVLIEFVSANPTGPLHLGHGRGGIIGDVLMRVGKFLGYQMTAEFYVNDAGSQMQRLGESLRVRVEQNFDEHAALPENGYAGQYLVDVAQELLAAEGKKVLEKPIEFFTQYAQEKLINIIKKNLSDYRIYFDNWFSEKSLHTSHAVNEAIANLQEKNIIYENEGALWFRSTDFGDDKDRVIKKQNGELTYIAADIAYHKNKYDRGYDKMINILGQDHHGYVMRLKATIEAMGYDAEKLAVVLYQLVSIKKGDAYLKMSKRAGNFEQLGEVISLVGADVARFFYLNRKADAHLDFDLDVALKKTDENPVFYIHYAYVRTGSIIKRAIEQELITPEFRTEISPDDLATLLEHWSKDEYLLLKKIWSLHALLPSIMEHNQTHTLAYYTYELAQQFHQYYAHHHVIDSNSALISKARLVLIHQVRSTLDLCLDLLGLSKPEAM